MRSFFVFIFVLAIIAVVAAGGGAFVVRQEMMRPGPHAGDVTVLLKEGASVKAIAEQLEDAGVLRQPILFVAAVRLKGVDSVLKAGEYRIPVGTSVWELVDLIVAGKSILHYLTVAEGLTTSQTLKVVVENEELTGELTLSPGEGELLPETYAFTRGETRDQIVARMMKAQKTLIDSAWNDRALELPISTREEAVILASIVEKETGVASERPRIAAVFVNRLKRGMRLESDPTIIYGLTRGEPLGRGLRVSEIKKETPYNTYRISGLPPTPIANPGRDSILAVLNPADTNDLFFVADGSGGHAFAETLAEHNRNVAEWRRIEKERRSAPAKSAIKSEADKEPAN
ncbi:MAG: endolytic transglycosylase MltG [Alphaproteobacteria bacterium]|nr:endolytic transglycosylase MltG [Alphaproteobacteria bacterium]